MRGNKFLQLVKRIGPGDLQELVQELHVRNGEARQTAIEQAGLLFRERRIASTNGSGGLEEESGAVILTLKLAMQRECVDVIFRHSD